MTYPPGSGPYGPGPQPGDGGWGRDPYQPGGWDAQPTGWEAPSWDQQQPQQNWDQPAYGGGYGAPPPPKNNSGLIVGIVFGVIALLVVGAGIAVVATRDSDSKNTAATSSTAAGLVPATTDESTATTAPATTEPGQGTSPHVSYQDYAEDWNFKLGDVEMHADWVQGRDHPSCSDIEVGGKLTALGCQYAAEMVYKAENGSLMLTQFIMGMSSAAQAEAAPGQYTDADLKLRPGTYVDHFAVGKWKDDAQKDYLVVTFATATNAVDEETAKKYLKYRHADILGALAFR